MEFSEDHRKKLSEAAKGKVPWSKGKRLTEEHRRKISEANKGKPSPLKGIKFTEEHKRKIARAATGRKLDGATRAKIKETARKHAKVWTEEEKIIAQKKREETMMRKYGVRNAQQIKKVNERMVKTQQIRRKGFGIQSEKGKETSKHRYGTENPMSSKVVQTKLERTFQKKHGVSNPMQIPEIAKKVSETKKGQPSQLRGKTYNEIFGEEKTKQLIEEKRVSGALGQSVTPRISTPQRLLFAIVKEVYSNAKLEYPVFGFCLDIAIPDLKISIEYDGSYWHDEIKDTERDEILAKLGWKVVRFVDRVPSKDELIRVIETTKETP